MGSVDGNRLWGKELEMGLQNVEWSPDGRRLAHKSIKILSYHTRAMIRLVVFGQTLIDILSSSIVSFASAQRLANPHPYSVLSVNYILQTLNILFPGRRLITSQKLAVEDGWMATTLLRKCVQKNGGEVGSSILTAMSIYHAPAQGFRLMTTPNESKNLGCFGALPRVSRVGYCL